MSFMSFLRSNLPFLSVGVLLTFSSSFGQTFFISIFAGEIRADFGLSHASWGAIYSLGTTLSAGVMLWAGVFADRLRVRVLGSLTLAGLAVACVAMALVSQAWMLVPIIFLLRLCGQGMCTQIAQVAMARWFVAARGRALSVATMGVALGEATLPIGFVALMGVVGWRSLWLLAAALLLLALPLALRLLRLERTPNSQDAGSHSLGMNGRHWTRGHMLRHGLFWFAVPALLAPAAFGTAFFFQQVHIAEVKGWAHVELVALFPLFTVVGIGGVLASGWMIDRWGTARMMPVYQLPMAAGFALIGVTDSIGMAAVGMVLMGITQGANTTLPAAFWAEFYGTRNLGAIRAVAAAVMVFGTAVGPALTGALIDEGIPFPDQMLAISVYFLAAAVVFGLGTSRYAATLPVAREIDVERT